MLFLGIFGTIIVATKGINLIIDTDGVYDDIRALTIPLSTPNTTILAITTVKGGVSAKQAALNVNRLLHATKSRPSIPIYVGEENGAVTVWEEVFGFDGIGGVPDAWPKVDGSSEVKYGGVDAILNITRSYDDVVLVCIGPLTNIARALKKDPLVAKRLKKIIIMGGNYLGIGNSRTNSTAEFNFLMDPEAAQYVLKRLHTIIVPWDTSFLRGPEYSKLVDYEESLKQPTRISAFLNNITAKARHFNEIHNQQYAFIDDIAVAIGIDESIATQTMDLYANVELSNQTITRGQVTIDWLSTSFNPKTNLFESENEKNDAGWLKQTFVTEYNVKKINNLLLTAVEKPRVFW